MTLGAADERAHRPDGDGWWEAWQLDVASDDGVGVAVLLASAPALGRAWWWTHVILPDRPGPVVVRDHQRDFDAVREQHLQTAHTDVVIAENDRPGHCGGAVSSRFCSSNA